MIPIYGNWIETWLESNAAYGNCKRAAEAMAEQFPELTVVCGYVETNYGRRDHFWLKDFKGDLIDPTISQFQWVLEYEEFKPNKTWVRVGKCMNCGEDILRKIQSLDEMVYVGSACSSACEKALDEYYNKKPEPEPEEDYYPHDFSEVVSSENGSVSIPLSLFLR
jgi:hypothetical protein